MNLSLNLIGYKFSIWNIHIASYFGICKLWAIIKCLGIYNTKWYRPINPIQIQDSKYRNRVRNLTKKQSNTTRYIFNTALYRDGALKKCFLSDQQQKNPTNFNLWYNFKYSLFAHCQKKMHFITLRQGGWITVIIGKGLIIWHSIWG